MRELRDPGAKRLVKQDLFVGVRQMILAANYVRNAHLDIVEHDRKVIKRMAIRAQQHQILNFGIGTLLLAVNNVGET